MKRRDREHAVEELLWEVGRVSREGRPEESVDVDAAAFERYRTGRSSEDERRRIERALAEDDALRRRLFEETVADGSGPRVPEESVVLGSPEPHRPGSRRGRTIAAAAALAAVVLSAVALVLVRQDDSRPSGPLPARSAIDVALRGSSQWRGETPLPIASRDSLVHVAVTVREGASSDLRFGVYRLDEDALHRMPFEPELGRGTAAWYLPVSRFADPGSEHAIVFVAVTRGGRLPGTVPLPLNDADERIWIQKTIRIADP